jgi:NAD(P)-dependent dehydrogenase (short-subunit alcohol dehydrogenase family)
MAGDHTLPVVVVTGAGGIGAATARRLGSGKLLVLADCSSSSLESTASLLRKEGYNVQGYEVDIANYALVVKLANDAATLGRIETVVHTAGVSPPTASVKEIYDVNLLGTAHVIDAFQLVMPSGSAMVCIASAAAHFGNDLSPEVASHFSAVPPDKLLQTAAIDLISDDPGKAYRISKRANILRVQSASYAYGARGVRINAISPGIVATSMGHDLLDGPTGDRARNLIATSPIKRMGTAAEVAEAVAFLAGPTALFITAAELLVDGGATAAVSQAQQSQK